MALREISRIARGTSQAALLWFIWYETYGRPYAYTRGRQLKAQDYTEYGPRAKVRLRPPEFSWQVQASIRAVEDASCYHCIQKLHRIFTALSEGQAAQVKEIVGPIVDFAVDLYDAEVKNFLDIDAPNGDFNSFEATSGIMILCVPEGMLPKRRDNQTSPSKRRYGPTTLRGQQSDIFCDTHGIRSIIPSPILLMRESSNS
jgi:hypothetical protein